MPCRSSASATATAKSCCEGRGAKPGICVASTPPAARAARLRCARVPLSPDSMSETVDAGDRALVDALLRGRRAGGVAFQQARLLDRRPVAAAQRTDLRTGREGAAGQRFGLGVVAQQQRGLGALLQQGWVVRHDLQRLVERFGGFGVVLLRFQALGLLAQVFDLGVAQRLDRELAVAVARGGADGGDLLLRRGGGQGTPWWRRRRSEEHTSELQSLMRISYAVFC